MDKKSPRQEGMKRFWGRKFSRILVSARKSFHFGKVAKHLAREEELRRKTPESH